MHDPYGSAIDARHRRKDSVAHVADPGKGGSRRQSSPGRLIQAIGLLIRMLDGNMNTPQVLSQTSTEQRKICKPHKVYIPRKSRDYSQPLRYTVQLLFLLLNLALA